MISGGGKNSFCRVSEGGLVDPADDEAFSLSHAVSAPNTALYHGWLREIAASLPAAEFFSGELIVGFPAVASNTLVVPEHIPFW